MMILGRKIKSRQGKAVAYNSNSTLALEYVFQMRILIQNIIEIINNKARHTRIDEKYQQMVFQLVPTTLLFGIWSNKSDANLEDSDCTVRMLLFVSIIKEIVALIPN